MVSIKVWGEVSVKKYDMSTVAGGQKSCDVSGCGSQRLERSAPLAGTTTTGQIPNYPTCADAHVDTAQGSSSREMMVLLSRQRAAMGNPSLWPDPVPQWV
jgi:hypothetical protein